VPKSWLDSLNILRAHSWPMPDDEPSNTSNRAESKWRGTKACLQPEDQEAERFEFNYLYALYAGRIEATRSTGRHVAHAHGFANLWIVHRYVNFVRQALRGSVFCDISGSAIVNPKSFSQAYHSRWHPPEGKRR
jgi:hypothetical protein